MVGIENTLLKDEGIRVHIVQALQKLAPPDGNLQTIDGGTSSDVFLHLQRIEKLVIIDAAEEGSNPSTIYRFDPKSLTQDLVCLNSVHQLGLPQSLKIMDYYGIKPKEIIGFGVEPKEIDWGLEPSHELMQKILEIANLMLEEVKAR
jgi:hydrogenase maturation protease